MALYLSINLSWSIQHSFATLSFSLYLSASFLFFFLLVLYLISTDLGYFNFSFLFPLSVCPFVPLYFPSLFYSLPLCLSFTHFARLLPTAYSFIISFPCSLALPISALYILLYLSLPHTSYLPTNLTIISILLIATYQTISLICHTHLLFISSQRFRTFLTFSGRFHSLFCLKKPARISVSPARQPHVFLCEVSCVQFFPNLWGGGGGGLEVIPLSFPYPLYLSCVIIGVAYSSRQVEEKQKDTYRICIKVGVVCLEEEGGGCVGVWVCVGGNKHKEKQTNRGNYNKIMTPYRS